jgi:hypothetical protein
VEEGLILPVYVPTDSMKADKLTKPFGGAKTRRFFGRNVDTIPETHKYVSSEGVCRDQDRDV